MGEFGSPCRPYLTHAGVGAWPPRWRHHAAAHVGLGRPVRPASHGRSQVTAVAGDILWYGTLPRTTLAGICSPASSYHPLLARSPSTLSQHALPAPSPSTRALPLLIVPSCCPSPKGSYACMAHCAPVPLQLLAPPPLLLPTPSEPLHRSLLLVSLLLHAKCTYSHHTTHRTAFISMGGVGMHICASIATCSARRKAPVTRGSAPAQRSSLLV